jgi:hypothetical protein
VIRLPTSAASGALNMPLKIVKGLRFLYQLRPAMPEYVPIGRNTPELYLVSKPLSPKSHHQGGQCGDCGRQGVEPCR